VRVMVLVKATEDSEKGFLPTAWASEMLEAMGKFNDELRNAGILLAADGLKPSMYGKRIAFDGAGRTVIDGPFTETREAGIDAELKKYRAAAAVNGSAPAGVDQPGKGGAK